MRIGIIGTGLIGSSLIRAFNNYKIDSDVFAFDSNPVNVDQLRSLGLNCILVDDIVAVALNSDVIFICTPVKAVVPIIEILMNHCSVDTIITDVGSTKGSIVDEMRSKFPDFRNFVPGHPISGAEHSGPLHGRSDLFKNKRYILTPYTVTSPAAVEIVALMLKEIGANVSQLDAVDHDKVLSLVSHLPHLCAYSLMNAASSQSNLLGFDVLEYTGGAFADVTRIAAADVRMWVDIFDENRVALLHSYELFREQAELLAGAIKRRDFGAIEKLIVSAREEKINGSGRRKN